jgi:aldehyde:ferredoxin oxidoreductase
MGAVMGSKNLKAVAVQGSGKAPVVNTEEYNSWRSAANRALREDVQSRIAREYGTASVADYYDFLGEMPKRYYQMQQFESGNKISGPYITENLLVGVSACHACVIACGRVVDLGDGIKRKGPEYETLVGFGPNLLIDDPVFTTRMGELCDRYGMDTISLSNTIGLALMLFERGNIRESDTGGMQLAWGDQTVVERLVHLTVRREGLGEVISKGARALGETFGAVEEAVQVNGLEAAFHDPRGSSGLALVYATSPRGACHNQSDYYLVDIGQAETSLGLKYYHRQAGAEKSANVAIHQNWRTLANSLVLCFFANTPPETVLNLINSACGLDWDLEEMLACGERGWNLKRVINNRLGLNKINDKLPKAFLKPYSDRGESMDYVPEFESMLEAYYQFREWDLNTGIPQKKKLEQLRLGWTIKDLRLARD